MATIVERSGRFLARVRRGGLSTSKTFTKKTDAQAWARRTEADMEAGRWQAAAMTTTAAQAPTPTLREAIGDYRVKVSSKQKGAKEAGYRLTEFAAAPFAAKVIGDVTPFDLAQWRDVQLATNKPSTVARKLGILSGIFTWAMKEQGWINGNPLSKVRTPRLGEGRARTLDADEWAWLMRAAASSKAAWLADALTVLARTAMRRSELFGLPRSAIDFEACTARLADTKNGSSRLVPLDPVAKEAMQRLAAAAEARKESHLLSVGAIGSVSTRFKVTVSRAQALYRADCKAHGEDPVQGFLADVRLHDLRHQAISHWASTGGLSLPELMAVSGHKTPRMLTRYAHISATALAQKLGQLSMGRQMHPNCEPERDVCQRASATTAPVQ